MIFLTAVLALAVSGLSLGVVAATDAHPSSSATFQEAGGAWLGVSIADTDAGVSVMQVTPGSPADEAGLRPGDVITAVDGQEVDSAEALVDLIATYAPGDEVTVTAAFRGTSTDYAVTLGERPADLDVTPPSVRTIPDFSMGGTFDLFSLNAEVTDEGLVIESIEDDSPFADVGLQEGDVITQINGADVTDLGGLMGAFRLSEPVTLTVDRDGEEITVEVDLSSLLPDLELPDVQLPDIEIRPGQGLGFGTMVARMLGLDAEMTDEGLLINEITDESPLADSGLLSGDVVTAINDVSLTDFQPGAIAELLADLQPGGTLTLSVLRDGEETTVEIGLPESFEFEFMPGAPGFGFRGGLGPMMGAGQPTQLGVQFAIITPDLAAERGLDVEEGALIEQVFEDTPAAQAGLQEGDIVTAVEGDPVDQRRTLRERLYAYAEGEVVTLTVLRDGEELSLDVTLGPSSGSFGMFRRGPNGEGGMFFFGPGMMDEEFFEIHPFFERGRRFDGERGPRRGDGPFGDTPEPSEENGGAAGTAA